MEPAGLDAGDFVRDTHGRNIVGDMGRVFLMMAQGADRIFHRGGTMRIRRWAQRRITHRCEIER